MHASNKNTKSELDGSIFGLWLLLHQSLLSVCVCSCYVDVDCDLNAYIQSFSCTQNFLHFVFDMINVPTWFFVLFFSFISDTVHTANTVAHARIKIEVAANEKININRVYFSHCFVVVSFGITTRTSFRCPNRCRCNRRISSKYCVVHNVKSGRHEHDNFQHYLFPDDPLCECFRTTTTKNRRKKNKTVERGAHEDRVQMSMSIYLIYQNETVVHFTADIWRTAFAIYRCSAVSMTCSLPPHVHLSPNQ